MNPPSILEMLSFYTRDRFRVTRGGFILDVESKDRGLEISTISSPFKDLVLSSKLRIKVFQKRTAKLVAAIKAGTSIRVDVFCRTKCPACRGKLPKTNTVHRTIKAAAVFGMNDMPIIVLVYVNEVNHVKLSQVVNLHKI